MFTLPHRSFFSEIMHYCLKRIKHKARSDDDTDGGDIDADDDTGDDNDDVGESPIDLA